MSQIARSPAFHCQKTCGKSTKIFTAWTPQDQHTRTRDTEQICTANGCQWSPWTPRHRVLWSSYMNQELLQDWYLAKSYKIWVLNFGSRAQKPVNASICIRSGPTLQPVLAHLETIQMRSWIVFLAAQLMSFKFFWFHLLSRPSLVLTETCKHVCKQKANRMKIKIILSCYTIIIIIIILIIMYNML